MVRRRNPRYYQGEFQDILQAIFSGKMSSGSYTALFEKKFAEYIGTKFALATCSGRNALGLLLDAFELKEGDEVIMPAYTLKDLVRLIKEKGLVPKLVDIEKESFNIDPHLIPREITSRTRAIIATHLFGLPSDMEKILEVAKQYNLTVIEDCAHALGARLKGRRLGALADAGFFSFETIKAINTFGGGMITTNNEKIIENIKSKLENYPAHNFGLIGKIFFSYLEDLLIKSPLYPLAVSAFMNRRAAKIVSSIYLSMHNVTRIKKVRFSNLQATLGLRQLASLEQRNELRDGLAGELEKKLNKQVSYQTSPNSEDRIFYFFVIKLLKSGCAIEEVRKKLMVSGIDSGIKNEITDNCAKYLGQEERFPVAGEIYERALQLPLYDNMTVKELDSIAGALNRILTKDD